MNELFVFFESITLLAVVKLLVLVLMVVYTVFAYLMMRQTASMTRAISMKDDYLVRGLSAMHFVMAALVLVIAVLIL